MNEVVERVAKAIHATARLKMASTWDGTSDGDKQAYRVMAHAAIKAISKPTIEMGLAGFAQLSLETSPHAAEDCWQAMITEALKEG